MSRRPPPASSSDWSAPQTPVAISHVGTSSRVLHGIDARPDIFSMIRVVVSGLWPQIARMPSASLDTPIGPLTVDARDGRIFRVRWLDDPSGDLTPELQSAIDQLRRYFEGTLEAFDLPLHVEGSDFQRAVCDAMSAIPLGETRTYGDLAAEIGAPAQAIGGACGGNPIPVIIPCHRVLGASGLGGFSGMGGVETKVWLLRHEKAGGLLI